MFLSGALVQCSTVFKVIFPSADRLLSGPDVRNSVSGLGFSFRWHFGQKRLPFFRFRMFFLWLKKALWPKWLHFLKSVNDREKQFLGDGWAKSVFNAKAKTINFQMNTVVGNVNVPPWRRSWKRRSQRIRKVLRLKSKSCGKSTAKRWIASKVCQSRFERI